jgi:predicted unusual protein kinase regulating ubiquinone biosynthesis (AarF/ABC1/UbiB family)
MQADLRNLTALVFPTRLTRKGQSIKEQVGAVKEMLEEEMDYLREAQHTRDARSLFTSADGIVVPKVFEEYSSPRVLTLEFISGRSFSEFLASNPSQEQRDEFGRKINLAWERMFYARMSHSDPHSGNFIFMDDGRLGVLDFGCVQRFKPEDIEWIALGERFFDGELTPHETLREGGFYTEKELADEEFMAPMRRHYVSVGAPILTPGPFDFGDAVAFKELVGNLQQMVKRVYPAPAMYVYMYRSIFGLRVLSYRLKCRFDMGALRAQERKPWT